VAAGRRPFLYKNPGDLKVKKDFGTPARFSWFSTNLHKIVAKINSIFLLAILILNAFILRKASHGKR
jgi:hypothetical protein